MTTATKAAAHTPGPWTYRETTANYDAGFHVEGPSRGTLAKGISEANARLIAAAPEMLEALECAETVLFLLSDEAARLGCRGKDVLPKVKAAIQKARGQ